MGCAASSPREAGRKEGKGEGVDIPSSETRDRQRCSSFVRSRELLARSSALFRTRNGPSGVIFLAGGDFSPCIVTFVSLRDQRLGGGGRSGGTMGRSSRNNDRLVPVAFPRFAASAKLSLPLPLLLLSPLVLLERFAMAVMAGGGAVLGTRLV